MTITVVTEVVQGWLLIDLCFLAIFQDETNFITQDFQNSTELSIYFLQLLLSWQLAFGGSYIQKLPIGSYFILAKCGTEPEVHSPPYFSWFFFLTFCSLSPFLPLPFYSFLPADNTKGPGTETMPQMKRIRLFFLLSLLLPVILVSANKTFVSLIVSVLHCGGTQGFQKW